MVYHGQQQVTREEHLLEPRKIQLKASEGKMKKAVDNCRSI